MRSYCVAQGTLGSTLWWPVGRKSKNEGIYVYVWLSRFAVEANATLESNYAPAPAQLLSRVQLFTTPWTVAYQTPLSMDFSTGARMWVAMPSSWGSPQPRDWTRVSCFSCIGNWILYHWDTWEALSNYIPITFKKKKKTTVMAPSGKSYNTHMEWVDYRTKTFTTHLWGLSTPSLFLTTGTFQNTCAHIIQWFFMIK